MDPTQISQELGIEAEHSFRAGQPRHSKSGVAPATMHTESYWLAPLSPVSKFGAVPFEPLPNVLISQHTIDAALERNLAWALGLSAAQVHKHAAFMHAISSQGGEISLLITLSAAALNPFSIPPQVSRMFGEMGITLEFEITND
jgi:hypothetical protein